MKNERWNGTKRNTSIISSMKNVTREMKLTCLIFSSGESDCININQNEKHFKKSADDSAYQFQIFQFQKQQSLLST